MNALSPSHANTADSVRHVARDAWSRPPRIWSTMSSRAYRCGSGDCAHPPDLGGRSRHPASRGIRTFLYIAAPGILPPAAFVLSCTSPLPASCLPRHSYFPVHRRFGHPASRGIRTSLYIAASGIPLPAAFVLPCTSRAGVLVEDAGQPWLDLEPRWRPGAA